MVEQNKPPPKERYVSRLHTRDDEEKPYKRNWLADPTWWPLRDSAIVAAAVVGGVLFIQGYVVPRWKAQDQQLLNALQQESKSAAERGSMTEVGVRLDRIEKSMQELSGRIEKLPATQAQRPSATPQPQISNSQPR